MDKCSEENCSLDVYSEDKCILHCEKTEENGWFTLKDDGSKDWKISEDKSRNFYYEFTKKINNTNNLHKENPFFVENAKKDNFEFTAYRFENIIFPEFPKDSQPFYNLLKTINIYFENCYFLGDADFNNLTKVGDIYFNECYFYEDIKFKKQEFENLFIFESCHVYKKATFRNVVFKGTTSFNYTTFHNKVDFMHTKFEGLALFNGTRIKELNFSNTFFKVEANFLGIKKEDGKKLEAKNIANRETARVIKHSFDEIGNIIEANKFYALEMEKQSEELKYNENFADWLVFKLHSLSSNHSQNWILPLLWIFIIGILSTYILNNKVVIDYDIAIGSGVFILLSIITIISYKLSKYTTYVVFLVASFLIFNFILLDKTFVKKDCIDYSIFTTASKQLVELISPFTKINDMTIGILIVKVIIAYLIYQFIVSVRQNTRRK